MLYVQLVGSTPLCTCPCHPGLPPDPVLTCTRGISSMPRCWISQDYSRALQPWIRLNPSVVTLPRGGMAWEGGGPGPGHTRSDGALGQVVVCSSAVKSRSCVSGVQRCTCGLSKLLNKRNSSLVGVLAAVPMEEPIVVMAKGTAPGYRSSHHAAGDTGLTHGIQGPSRCGLGLPKPLCVLLGRAGETQQGRDGAVEASWVMLEGASIGDHTLALMAACTGQGGWEHWGLSV